MFTIVLLLIIITVVTIFSVQNAAPVAISFLFWRFDASLAIVIFLSVLTGVVITAIIVSSVYIKQSVKKPK
ncbi:MAG: LapA family protein [Nitrospirota bacterium]